MTKGIVLFLVFVVVVAIAGMDAASIFVTKYRVNDLAEQAAFEGAGALNRTGSAGQACEAAIELVTSQSESAKVPKEEGCIASVSSGEVTVTVREGATTIVVKRLDFLSDLTQAEATATSAGPTL